MYGEWAERGIIICGLYFEIKSGGSVICYVGFGIRVVFMEGTAKGCGYFIKPG